MALYDLFIKGIRPERLDEKEQIKKKASQSFKIEEDKLEALWSAPGGLCIRRNISREEASQIQSTLAKAGLICLNTPSVSGSSLSLVAKDDEKKPIKRDFICPYCAIKIVIDNGQPDPVNCPECSGIIAKYAETQERKEIRNRLMNSNAAKERQEMQLIKAEAERVRKKKIEEEIGEELFGKQKIKVNKTLLVAGSAAILIASGAAYLLTSNKDKTSNIVASTATSSLDHSSDHSPAAVALSGDAPQPTFASGGPSDAQSALQDTHDKANKVLGAFGLDADRLGKNVGGATVSSSGTTKLVSILPSATPSDMKKSAQSDANTTPVAVTLLQDGENNQEWDLFLNQHITNLIEGNKLPDAYKLAQYLIDTEDYINIMGLLLARAQQSNQDKLINEITIGIESRINTLPAPNQAEYLAQAGYYQLVTTKKNDLLKRAETVLNQIPSSDDQLKAVLKIAVYNFKSNNTETANNYFSKVDGLLVKIKSPDEQVNARAAISRAYYDVNDSTNAIKWLASADNLIPEVSISTLKELIGSYAYANQLQTTLQNIAKEKHSELLYRAVQVSLKSNLLDKAISISKDIQDSTYKALAADLIASYAPSIAGLSLDLAGNQLQTIKLPTDKAIVASRLSRHYARIGNIQRAAELITETENQIKKLPSSNERDEVIAIIIKNFTQSLQFDIANNLTILIGTDAIKSSVINNINMIKGIGISS